MPQFRWPLRRQQAQTRVQPPEGVDNSGAIGMSSKETSNRAAVIFRRHRFPTAPLIARLMGLLIPDYLPPAPITFTLCNE